MKPTEFEIVDAGILFSKEDRFKDYSTVQKDCLAFGYSEGYENGISQMQPEWVPVTERLPKEEDVKYLVAVRNKNKEGGIWLLDIASFSEGVFTKSDTWETVVLWSNLPQPPTK